MGSLDGQHALVTGGGSGIGAAIARALAAEGAALTIAGRRETALRATAEAIGGAVATVVADVTSEIDCVRMVAAARAAHGPLDIVVANAGAAESAQFAETDNALWSRMIEVNLAGAYHTARAAIGELVGAKGATNRKRLIFVASTAGLKGYPYVAAYVAAKHGVVGLTRALALEYARSPLTVNAVCPGFTETPLLDTSVATIMQRTGRPAAEARALLVRTNPQDRLIQPREVAATVIWLCSADAASITGQAISISGGEA